MWYSTRNVYSIPIINIKKDHTYNPNHPYCRNIIIRTMNAQSNDTYNIACLTKTLTIKSSKLSWTTNSKFGSKSHKKLFHIGRRFLSNSFFWNNKIKKYETKENNYKQVISKSTFININERSTAPTWGVRLLFFYSWA